MSDQLKWIIITFAVFVQCYHCSRILCVTPNPSYSHSVFYNSIFDALAKKGHELVKLTTDPVKDPPPNVKQIDWHFAYEIRHKTHNITNAVQKNEHNVFKILSSYEDMFRDILDAELSHPEVKNVIKNKTEHFDLVIVELMMFPMYYFSYRFNCPFIIISSTDAPNFVHAELGNPAHALTYPEELPEQDDLPFKQRLKTAVQYIVLFFIISMRPVFHSWHLVAKKHFGDDIPSIEEIKNNASMIFINTHPVYSNRPLSPGFVAIGGGTHIQPPKLLPPDIQDFLDNAKDGTIYFSLGTNVLNNHLTPELIDTFVQTFKELRYNVLWKFETDIENLSNNVKIINWAPQQDILRHQNIKLFITQCGMQSLDEALVNSVPMVGIPFISDQNKNAAIISNLEVAMILNKKKITKETFKGAILEVIQNPSYKQNAVKTSKLLQDTPMTGVEKAVWWTEYVLRHKGTPHFWNKNRSMPLYQYYFIDVIALILAVVTLLVLITLKTFQWIVNKLFTNKTDKKCKFQ